MNRRRNNNFSKTMKDYLVPIVGLLLIIILAWSIFGGGDDSIEPNTNNGVGLEITLDSDTTEAAVVYEGDYKQDIEGSAKLFKGEKVVVTAGAVDITLDGIGDFKLDKLGELKYNIADDFTLFSSNMWFNSDSETLINLQFGNSVKVGANSTISISQNDVQATVYLLHGAATVYTSTGKELSLAKAEQITLSRQDSINEDTDLALLKKEFGEFFKVSDWYIKNNGDFFLNQGTTDDSNADANGVTGSGATSTSLTSVFDESSVSTSPIKIEGVYNTDTTAKITINNIDATLDGSGIFKIDQFNLTAQTNDLVVKTFNNQGTIDSKQVYTIYYAGGSNVVANTATTAVAQPITGTVNTTNTLYSVDATQFGFTAPSSSGQFSTTGSEITIRGITTAEGIASVTVDGFKLASFNGSTWRYHAFTRFENLQVGTNQYEIKYFGEDGNLVYTDYYTIVKKEAGAALPAEQVTEIISDEA